MVRLFERYFGLDMSLNLVSALDGLPGLDLEIRPVSHGIPDIKFCRIEV